MFKKSVFFAILAAISLSSTADAADVVRFGTIRVPVQVFVGLDKGFFVEEGIEVEPVFFKSGTEIAPAIATGQVDAAITTAGAAMFNAMARGADFTIVAEALSLEPNAPGGDPTAIVVRSGAIKDVADLKGKTLAVTAPGQILDIIVKTYLGQHGIGPDEVNTVGMAMPDMVLALTNGAIDGAIMIDPFLTMVVDSGTAEVLASSSEVMPNASQSFVVMSDGLMQRREIAVRFLRAYVKTNSWMREALPTSEGRAEIAAIFQKYVPAADASVYERIALGTASESAEVKVEGEFGLQWQLQTLIDQGLIQGAPDLEAHLDRAMLAEALGN